MFSKEDFAEQYKPLEDAALIDILKNTDLYQPIAIEAAQEEFKRRNLTEKDLYPVQQTEAFRELPAIPASGRDLLGELNDPFEKMAGTYNRIFVYTTSFFGLVVLSRLWRTIVLLMSMMHIHLDKPALFIALQWPVVLGVTGFILYSKRKTAGWIALMIFSADSAVQIGYSIYLTLDALNAAGAYEPRYYLTYPYIQMLYFFIYCIVIIILCTRGVRNIYQVDNDKMFTFLTCGIALSIATSVITTLVLRF